MNLENGQHIKIFFRNGAVEEGIIIKWTERQSVLKSLSSDNLLIIQNTSADIMAVKVFIHSQENFNEEPQSAADRVYIDEELNLPEPERNINLRALKLADLRIKRGEKERERARQLLTTFHNAGIGQKDYYGIPRKLSEPPSFDSTEED